VIDLTVVVLTRNRSGRLRECLTRLMDLPEKPEIVVVDNGSEDDTERLVRVHFPVVRLIRLATNQGAPARNIGVAAANTTTVAFADDDSSWEPGALAKATDLMARHPRLALIAANVLVGADAVTDPLSTFMASAPLGWEADLPGPSVLGFLACAAVVRRSAFTQVGGFDPVVFFMGEETRVAYDLARRGWGLAYCADVVARHFPDRAGVDPHKRALIRRNIALTAWMRRPLSVALRDSADAIRCAVTEKHPEAVWDLVRRIPAALVHRTTPSSAVETQIRHLRRIDPTMSIRQPSAGSPET
jgi:GT2 family glycosyltransferase